MNREQKGSLKNDFACNLSEFTSTLCSYVSTEDKDWTIKGFIDVYKNVYTISTDTKVLSKILEIHLLPKLLIFAESIGYGVVLTEKQNYYPDLSLISKADPEVKLALDIKTTYRDPEAPECCKGFTLGSHGAYFRDRASTKNIQFPYSQYLAHFLLGVIYTRTPPGDPSHPEVFSLSDLHSIRSVARDFLFFSCERWEIASDKSGSGNTASIGSIRRIDDILNRNGVFKDLGEAWFDDYWINYGRITVTEGDRQQRITSLEEFLRYRNANVPPRARRRKARNDTA